MEPAYFHLRNGGNGVEGNEHENHRERMYKRYDRSEIKDFEKHEVLEMLLFYAIPRKNTNPIAHRLIKEFGSLEEVLKAPPHRLMQVNGVGPAVARYFRLWREVFSAPEWNEPPKKLTDKTATAYFKALFKGETREVFYMICLDPKDNILACEKISEGTFESTTIDQSKVARLALKYDSAQVVFAHNHPSGVDKASGADINVTEVLEGVLFTFGIRVRDHIIYTDKRCVSILGECNLRRDRSLKNRGRRR